MASAAHHGPTGASATPLFASPSISAERRADGTILLSSDEPLGPYPPSMAHVFRAGAQRHPERILASARVGDGREIVCWGAARERVDALAQALLNAGLGPDRPLMVLSGNSLEHLMLTLAAYTAGVPVLPVSAAYSLLSRDHDRLRRIVALCAPGMVFADDAGRFAAALDAVAADVPVAAGRARRAGAGIALRGSGGDRPGDGDRARLRARGARHGGQGALHLRVDGRPEGRREHPPDALLEPAGARADMAIPARRAARARRLASVEPHVRRQPQPRAGPGLRRDASPRRRQAGTGAVRPDG